MNARDRAVGLLDHYITLLMEREGTRRLKVDADTHVELAELVDAIIEASVEEARRIVADDSTIRGKL